VKAFVVYFGILAFSSPIQAAQSGEIQGLVESVEDLRLPLLLIRPIMPIKEASEFKIEWGFYATYRRANDGEFDRTPYASDREAIAAADQFIKDHFDTGSYSLILSRIDDSATENSRPVSEAALGRTFVFNSAYRGIRLNGHGAVVYIAGKTITHASFMLGEIVIVPCTEMLLLEKRCAVDIWREAVRERTKIQNPVPGKVSLQYVWSVTENQLRDSTDGDILSPNWVIELEDGSGELLVDARDGRVWRND